MKLTCPGCGALISAADTNVDTGVAKCRACNEILNIFKALGLPSPTGADVSGRAYEELVPRPPKMMVEDLGNTLWSVRYRWFEPSLFFLLFFCIAWDSFLVFWYSMALFGNGPWLMIVFPIAHVAVGVGLTYRVLAGFLNTTQLRLDGMDLVVKHGPIYWFGNQRLPIDTIAQLYCRRGKAAQYSRTRDQESYELWATLQAGGEVRLVIRPTLGEVRFLEQQIESKLGIKPAAVVGECLNT